MAKALPEDAAAIAAIANDVIRHTTITFTSEEKTAESIASQIRERNSYFVLHEHNEIVGYACYFPFRHGPGYAHTYEHTITLAPGSHGKGAGRALLTALAADARAAGGHSLFAGVSGENQAGVAFHRALGFHEVARLPEVGYKFGRWLDLVLMQKFL